MAGIKRPYDDNEAGLEAEENVHPSRKRRVEDGESHAGLNKIINNLRDEEPTIRLNATRELLKNLASISDDQKSRIDHTTTRLIKGVCSGAKAARPGFSIALIEVLRLAGSSKGNLIIPDLLNKIKALTSPDGKKSGEEQRNYLLGRKLALQAILQSGILQKASESDQSAVFASIGDLALEKEWLRTDSGAMIRDFLEGNEVKDDYVRPLFDSLASKGLLKSPEGIALWLVAKNRFKNVKLPKGIWHHNNPLSAQERATLTKILLRNAVDADDSTTIVNGNKKKAKTSGSRQIVPSFAWSVILNYLYSKDEGKELAQFWDDCVAKPMFSSSSSAERRSLGLQIFKQALSDAPADLLGDVVHANIIRCIVDQRSKQDRPLFAAAKLPLQQMEKRAQEDTAAAAEMVSKLLEVIPANVDKLTKHTIDVLLAAADGDGLVHVVKVVFDLCRVRDDVDDAERKRRALADALLTVVRSNRSEPSQLFKKDKPTQWLEVLLEGLADLSFRNIETASPVISEASRGVFQERLISILGHLVNLPLAQAVVGPTIVLERLHSNRKHLIVDLNEDSKAAIKSAREALKAAKAQSKSSGNGTVPRAFQLLLSLGTLQVYKQEPDSVGVLQDITACHQSPQDGDASTMLIELLLSFVSKQSALFRKLAEQVFGAFAPDVTAEGLQSMIDILSQKESIAGQNELFKEGDAESGAEESDAESDEEMENVEDASDVELVNGEIAGNEEESDNSDSDDEASSPEDEADNDELTEFNRKLTDALGTAGMEEGSDEDESDMDDDQMMALEPHLTTIFKERKSTSTKKQDNKSAKETILNFKNRVLDLLQIYVKNQFSNPLALDLLHPLVELTRTTTSQPTARKALEVLETYFDSSKKNKSIPKIEDEDAVLKISRAIHQEMRLGGSKLHATACSRASLFLTKVMMATNEGGEEAWKKVAGMYVELQQEWRKGGSKIHVDILKEWNSWSLQK